MRNRITCTVKQGRGRTIEKPVKNELDGPEPAQTVECSRAVPEHSCVRQRCCAITPVTPPFSELRGAFTGRSSGRSARKGLLLVASLAPASPPLVVPSRPSHTLVAPPAAGRRHLVEVGAWQQEEDGGEGQGGGCGGVYVTVTHMASERGGHSRRLLLGTPSPPSSILQREVRSNRTQCWHPVPSPVLRRPRPPPLPLLTSAAAAAPAADSSGDGSLAAGSAGAARAVPVAVGDACEACACGVGPARAGVAQHELSVRLAHEARVARLRRSSSGGSSSSSLLARGCSVGLLEGRATRRTSEGGAAAAVTTAAAAAAVAHAGAHLSRRGCC